MRNFILNTGINIRHSDFSLDYNLIGSIVDFVEIEDEALRDKLINSFLDEDYITPTDKAKVEAEEDKELEEFEEATEESEDEEPSNDETEEDDSEDEEEEKKTTRRASKVRGGKK